MSDRVPLAEAVDKDPEPTPAPTSVGPEHFGTYLDDPNYHEFSDTLGLDHSDRRDVKIAEKLSFLYNWGEQITDSKDKLDIMEAVKMIQRASGIQGEGKFLVNKLYKWARLDSQRKRLAREMELIK